MSYQEKNITVSLVSHLLILGYYVINVLQMLQGEGLVSNRLFSLSAIVIIAAIIVHDVVVRRRVHRWMTIAIATTGATTVPNVME